MKVPFKILIIFVIYDIHHDRLLNVQASPITRQNRKENIVGGHIVKEGKFKYQVSLQNNDEHICGGGIIDELFILTAAHCIIDIVSHEFIQKPLTAVMGIKDLILEKESAIKRHIEKMYVPKEFKPNSESGEDHHFRGDIAVLKLSEPIGLQWNDRVIKLNFPEKPYPSYEQLNAQISGYGLNEVKILVNVETHEEKRTGKSDFKMRYATTKIITKSYCEGLTDVTIYDSDICAKVKQHDLKKPEGVCSGDSGGPLVRHNVIIGVLSVSPADCNENLHVGVYSRVSSYMTFIENSMLDRRFNLRVAYWTTPGCDETSVIFEYP